MIRIARRFTVFNPSSFIWSKLKQQSMPYYAIAAGWKVGIFDTWASCEEKVRGFSKPKFKKFKTKYEAENFLKENGVQVDLQNGQIDPKTSAVPLGCTFPKSGFPKGLDLSSTSTYKPQTVKEDPPLSTVEDKWPDDVKWNIDDEDILLIAAAEIEGLCNRSLKRKNSSEKASSPNSKVLKKYMHESKIWEPIGLKKIGRFEFPIDSEGYVIVYTDGSCINNGQAGAVAGFGVYFSEGHPLNAAKPVVGRVTNNAGEIQAAIHAIQIAKDFGIRQLCLSTDSQFLINAITAWIKGWKRRGWLLKSGQPVKNADDFKILDQLLDGSVDIKWNYVKGHKGIEGNEKADKLARKGADLYREGMQK